MKISITASATRVDFSDLSFDASEDINHPNKMPFKGTLLILDRPSDQPPHGAEGHQIEVGKKVAEKRLRGLIGMGVNYATDLQGHDPQHKVGVITSASIVGDKVKVEGMIWKKDFPESEHDIKGNRSLGMSMELGDVLIADRDSDVWQVLDFQFTGATILEKDSAAYWSTSLAASAERMSKSALEAASSALGISQGGDEMGNTADKGKADADKPNQADILAGALKKSFTEGLQPLVDGMKASQEQNKDMMAAIGKLGDAFTESNNNILAAIGSLGVAAEGDTHAAADATNDATSGGDATTDATVAAAGGDSTSDSTNDSTRDNADATYEAGAEPTISAKPGEPGDLNPDATSHQKTQARSGASGQLKAEKDRGGKRVASISAAAIVIRNLHARAEKAEKELAKATKRIDALEAQGQKFAKRIERKSLSPEMSTLLAKGGYDVREVLAGAAGGKKPITIAEFDAMIERSNLNLRPEDRMRFKNEAIQAGFLEEGVVTRPWMQN